MHIVDCFNRRNTFATNTLFGIIMTPSSPIVDNLESTCRMHHHYFLAWPKFVICPSFNSEIMSKIWLSSIYEIDQQNTSFGGFGKPISGNILWSVKFVLPKNYQIILRTKTWRKIPSDQIENCRGQVWFGKLLKTIFWIGGRLWHPPFWCCWNKMRLGKKKIWKSY